MLTAEEIVKQFEPDWAKVTPVFETALAEQIHVVHGAQYCKEIAPLLFEHKTQMNNWGSGLRWIAVCPNCGIISESWRKNPIIWFPCGRAHLAAHASTFHSLLMEDMLHDD